MTTRQWRYHEERAYAALKTGDTGAYIHHKEQMQRIEEQVLEARRKREERIKELRAQYKEYAEIIVQLEREKDTWTSSWYTAGLLTQELNAARLTMQAIKDELASYNLRDIA